MIYVKNYSIAFQKLVGIDAFTRLRTYLNVEKHTAIRWELFVNWVDGGCVPVKERREMIA